MVYKPYVNMNVASFFICTVVMDNRDNSSMFDVCGTCTYMHTYIYHEYIP